MVTTLPRVANLAMTPDRVYPLYGFFYWLERVISRMTNIRFFTFLFGDSSAIVHYLRAIGYDLSRIEQTGSNFGMAIKHDTPFLSTVGTGTMVSDGLSIINADYTNSSFRVSRTTIGPRSFLGNNIAYPSGGRTGDNCLLATKVMVPLDGEVREGVGLLGSPPFQIPRSVERDAGFDELKQGGELGRRLAAKNRHNAVTIAAYLLVRWVCLYGVSLLVLPAVDQFSHYGAPLVTAAACLLTLFSVAYFVLVDRAVTRFRALQPRFCSIYDPYFWWHERYWKVPAMAYIGAFSGTPFKNLIWRLLGVRLGRRVFDDGCWMTERTLVAVGDDCTLNALSTLQSHSLEDGAFKSDHITIGAGCTVGINAFVHYGVTMGDGAVLEADAFLMKGEELAPHARWSGNPASERRDGSPEPAFPVAAGGARLGWETRLPAGLETLPVATTPPYGVVGVSPSIYLPRDPAPPTRAATPTSRSTAPSPSSGSCWWWAGPRPASRAPPSRPCGAGSGPPSWSSRWAGPGRRPSSCATRARPPGRHRPCSGWMASTGSWATPAGSTASCSAGSSGPTTGWWSWPPSMPAGATTCAASGAGSAGPPAAWSSWPPRSRCRPA